jgi:hypothetical protein
LNFRTTALAKNFTKIEEAALLAAQWLSCFMARLGAAEGTGMAAALWNAGVRGAAVKRARAPRRAERQDQPACCCARIVSGAARRGIVGHLPRRHRFDAAGRNRPARGDIIFTLPEGAFCRHLSFNNATTELMESTATPCPEAKPRGRESDRPSNHFAWGAR